MKIRCSLGYHKWGNWEYIKPIGRYEAKIKCTCTRCGASNIYSGLISKDFVTGEVEPLY